MGGTYGGKSRQNNTVTYMVGPSHYAGISDQDITFRYNGYSPKLQLNYTINGKHSLGGRYEWNHNTSQTAHGYFNTNSYLDSELTEHSSALQDMLQGFRKHLFNAYYNGTVGTLNINFNVDALFHKGNEDNATTETITMSDGAVTLRDVLNLTRTSNNLWATKLVLTYPVWQGELSVGGEYSHNHRTDTYTYESTEVLPTQASDNIVNETIASAFVEYRRQFGRLTIDAGLRYEHLTNDYYNFDVKDDEVSRHYGDLFPTVALSMPVGKTQMSFVYRKDITRPNYDQLSSSTIYVNRYSYQCGNPYLKPNYVHNVAYNLAYKWLNFNANYSRNIDYINCAVEAFTGSDDPYVSLVHETNADEAFNELDLTINAAPTIGKWHPSWSATVMFQDYKTLDIDGSEITCNHPYAEFRWSNDLELPCNLRLNASLSYNTRGHYAIYHVNKTCLNSTLGLQRDFHLGGDMGVITVDARVYNPLPGSSRGMTNMGLRQLESYNPHRTSYALSVTWKFNEASRKYRGTGAGNSQKQRM